MELGNMIFGNSRGEAEIPDSSRWHGTMARLLDAVGKALGEKHGDGYGYGRDFDNDTFTMMPYYWGDCECGFEDKVNEWCEKNPHTKECFDTRFQEEEDRLENLSYDARHKKMVKWAKANGCKEAPTGMRVYCDCGRTEKYNEFLKDKEHDSSCRIVRPNFLYKPTGFQVCWYKYWARDSYMTPEISIDEFERIINACVDSLNIKEPLEKVELSLEDAESIGDSFAQALNAANGWNTGFDEKKVKKDIEKFFEVLKKARRGG
jgi:hypothetical protein